MQIIGSLVSLTHAAVSESAWERRDSIVSPPVVQSDAQALIERPVAGIERPETVANHRPYSSPVRALNAGGKMRRALDAYESVQRLQAGEELMAFAGIDVYA